MAQNNVILISLLPPPYGGIAQWTSKLVELSPKYEINFRVVNEATKKERKHFGEKTKRNFFAEIIRTIRIRKDLKRALRETDESYIVHCNIPSLKFSMIRELLNLNLIKKYRRKYIIHFHSTTANNVDTSFKKKLLKKFLIKADRIILLNQQSFDFCSSIYKNDKMMILPNFISLGDTDGNHYINKSINNILYVGMVTPEKGADDIIEVAKFFPNISFNIIGQISDEIKNHRSNKNLNNVHLLGIMNKIQINEYYKKADLFLFLSRFKSEGFSVALCEAMGMGVPCIVTDWAANKDMVLMDCPNVIVKSNDISSLEKSIKALDDYELRSKLSKANYDKVMANYTEEVVINKLKEVYNSL